jgi:molybdopterin synthase catalytic subunit
MIKAQVTEEKIDAHALAAQIKNNQSGAVVIFSGDVRDNDHDRAVQALTYEIHPSAQAVIEEITARIAAKHELVSAIAVHRYGPIPIGESAFVVVVSAKHRKAAFAACDEMVDVVKAELPIWKYQVFADGTDEWVNNA